MNTQYTLGGRIAPAYLFDFDEKYGLDQRENYLIARNPSKHTHFMIVMISVKPALASRSRFPWVENGSRIPFRLRCLLRISASVKFCFSLYS